MGDPFLFPACKNGDWMIRGHRLTALDGNWTTAVGSLTTRAGGWPRGAGSPPARLSAFHERCAGSQYSPSSYVQIPPNRCIFLCNVDSRLSMSFLEPFTHVCGDAKR